MFPSNLYVGDKEYVASPVVEVIPDGYSVYRVKDWCDPYMVSIGYSAVTRQNVAQFQVISPFIFDAQMKYCGTLSSNTNFSRMTRSDVFKLANHQLLDFGYKWNMSEQEIISMLNVKLSDGFSLKTKMAWLIWGNNTWGAQGRCNGDWWDYLKDANGNYILDVDGKKREVEVQLIAIVHGGQKILASDETKYLNGQWMRRMINFRRSDWGKHYDTHPWLMQSATVAFPNGGCNDDHSTKGRVYCPVALDPRDFKFYTNKFTPDSYWIPANQMIKL